VFRPGALAITALLCATPLFSYSVLTHEAIIDAAWDPAIKPLLLNRFPQTTAEALVQAHAYAYGGAIVADMGYYPFGSHQFSDLLHYVRPNAFVINLIHDAGDANEYAFALGCLAHYIADIDGHSIGVNRAVPLVYPKLRARYEEVVPYEDDPAAHIKVEFGFDVSQVERGNYAPKAYHDFIGFEVAKEALERAFVKTYGFEMKELFLSEDLALGTFRHSVSKTIPDLTMVAWQLNKDQLMKDKPGLTRRKFVYTLSRAEYRKEWGNEYRRPGIGSRILAFFLHLIPQVGPFKALSFKPLTPEAETLVEKSFNATMSGYRKLLDACAKPDFTLSDENLDTGQPVRPGAYRMADRAYAKLVERLAGKGFAGVSPELRAAILRFYSDPKAPFATKADFSEWVKLNAALERLRTEAAPAQVGDDPAPRVR
jgi:hypothetical protein